MFYLSSLYRRACVSQAITLGICLICVPLVTLAILFAINNIVMLITNPDLSVYNNFQAKAFKEYKFGLSRILTEEFLNTITVFTILNLEYENWKHLRIILIALLTLGYICNVLGNSIKFSCQFMFAMTFIVGRAVISGIMFALVRASCQSLFLSILIKSILVIYILIDMFQLFHIFRLYRVYINKDKNNNQDVI